MHLASEHRELSGQTARARGAFGKRKSRTAISGCCGNSGDFTTGLHIIKRELVGCVLRDTIRRRSDSLAGELLRENRIVMEPIPCSV